MDGEHLLARLEIGQWHIDEFVESTSTQHRRVNLVGTVARCHNKDTSLGAVVHLREELVNLLGGYIVSTTVGNKGIELVEADHDRRILLGLIEELAYLLLTTVHKRTCKV